MENGGQADTGPGTLDDLADFLLENPDADAKEPASEDEGNPAGDEPQEDNSDEQDDAAAKDEDDESESDDPADEQPSGRKFKITVKGEDGADTQVEVDEKELVSGYQRHADYTRKTQELAHKEREAVKLVTSKLDEGRQFFMQQAQLARSAVEQLAGLKSPQEMALLAQTDPAGWVAEQQREAQIRGFLSKLDGTMQQQMQHAAQERQYLEQQTIAQAQAQLAKKGITSDKVLTIYENVHKLYGVPAEKLAAVRDPVLVEILRDAAAYRDLQSKKGAVTLKVGKATQMPTQRQSVPSKERADKRLNDKFRNGKAKVDDLAMFLHRNGL